MLRLTLMLSAITLPLAACSFGAPPPQSAADKANLAACTHQAEQIDAARHYAYLSRTDQFATPFLGTPNPEYLSNKLAQLHDQEDRINDCVNNANPSYAGSGAALPEPTIIGPTQ
ncbi:MAG: hypothetical protein PHT60_09635 [Acidiphilium sp.]|nr:hypothetical protein [Acidiphilium sp.]MDD4936024.1 hypothetical protein [Acidiphilium sp.]